MRCLPGVTVTPLEQLPTEPILTSRCFHMMSEEASTTQELICEIQELAKLAEQFTAYAREMHVELSKLQQQLEVIRQYQVLTHRHTNRPN